MISNMITKLFVFLCMIGTSYGFRPSVKPQTNFIFAGDTKPMGFWDPIKITENLNEDQIKLLAEVEKHHGRIAMVAMTILPVLEIYTDDSAINYVNNLSGENKVVFLALFSIIEICRMGDN